MFTLLLPGTLCDDALWVGLTLPADTRALPTVRGASWAEAAEQALGLTPPLERLHVVGFSLGAMLAFELLRRAPERVDRLTLLGANPHPPTVQQLEAWAGQEARVREGQFAEVARARAAFAGPHQAEVLEMALRVGPEIFLEQLALLRSRVESRPVVAAYGGPLTLLVGENDPLTPPHLSVELGALSARAEVQVIPGAGHYLPLEAPDALTQALRGVAYA